VWRRVAASSLEGGSLATPASSRSYEGGSKSGNGGGLAGLTVDGGEISIAGVDEMRARLAVGGGERESLAVR
jgi:hypothetical protein